MGRGRDVVGARARPLQLAPSLLSTTYRDLHVRGRHAPPGRAARPGALASTWRPGLAELLGQEELRELLDPDALVELERQLRGEPRTADELHDQLRVRGDLRPGGYDPLLAAPLLAERRALLVRLAGEERLIAAQDAGRYRDRAWRRCPRAASPTRSSRAAWTRLRRFLCWQAMARSGARLRSRPAQVRLNRPLRAAITSRRSSPGAGSATEQLAVRGELRPGGSEREWCDPDVLRRLRRASLAALRREVEPVEPAALARFLPSWHGIGRRASLREAIVPLQALALPVALWESELLPRRVPGYRPEQLDALCASGEVVWVGAGEERVALYFREDADALGRVGGAPAPSGEPHEALRTALERGALFWFDLVEQTALGADEALPALWDLVWAGEVTNDAWTPLRAGRRHGVPHQERRPRRFSRTRAAGATATQGRWARTEGLFQSPPERRALAELLLERHGILTRDGVRSEGIPGGYGAVYAELRALETLGLCRRGYFVEGLGGAQFALGGAVERLRELREAGEAPAASVLAAADPAQPYGAALPWPRRAGGRAARVAGAQVVLLGGEAVLYVERGGRSLVPLRDPDELWLRPALGALVSYVRGGGAKRLAVERFDGAPVTESDALGLLVDAGFLAGPRRVVLRP